MPEHKILRMDLSVTLQKPDVESSDPWSDDILDRKKMAKKLTELIRCQSEPFAISITGSWGTGKTFFLKRWQKDLENNNACVVYFNAWEDDCYDDPLVVILEQLINIAEENKLSDIAKDVWKHVKILVPRNIDSVANKFTGLRISVPEDRQNINYKERRESRIQVKKLLAKLSKKVKEKENRQYPLVFIVDELDRCRPLFAIELLERVKHIFDVKGIVFVFGINRSELAKSIQSIYGNIDSDAYLMRFFDMDFALPFPNMSAFCKYLFFKYGLLKKEKPEQPYRRNSDTRWGNFFDAFPVISSVIGLSLRDVEYCTRIVKFAASSRAVVVPELLSILTVLKVKNRAIYQGFLQGGCSGADVMNYVNKLRSPNVGDIPAKTIDRAFDTIELLLYATHSFATQTHLESVEKSRPFEQLNLLDSGSIPEELPHPEALANATLRAGKKRIEDMIYLKKTLFDWHSHDRVIVDDSTLGIMFELIELTNLPSEYR